jgi:hypothetical protein
MRFYGGLLSKLITLVRPTYIIIEPVNHLNGSKALGCTGLPLNITTALKLEEPPFIYIGLGVLMGKHAEHF